MSDPESPIPETETGAHRLKKVEQNLVQILHPVSTEPLPDELPHVPGGDTTEATLEQSKSAFLKLLEPPKEAVARRMWFRNRFIVLGIGVVVAVVAILLGIDKPIIGAGLVGFGLLSQLFTGLLALIGLIPVIGPIIVGALSLPFIWLMNGLGYVFTIKFAAEGKGRLVLNWRTMTIVFITGIVIGIVIGRLLPGR